ncbi:Aste57867_14489 [Aphanomyces stellatus]|uniref:Aste57867_14489 protein n=1 Tax=Aphanomyces stellatus TaxID=120398 RepID=A0A485L0S1_9STRA|nr:hypothetical protein As57867_014435 [Aphanomyces stellatus]VFT91311.1 Aste57867_14489 [Aphanomyces stellatus]
MHAHTAAAVGRVESGLKRSQAVKLSYVGPDPEIQHEPDTVELGFISPPASATAMPSSTKEKKPATKTAPRLTTSTKFEKKYQQQKRQGTLAKLLSPTNISNNIADLATAAVNATVYRGRKVKID